MLNNIGITNEIEIRKIEYYLFNTKYHIIDESYTFNESNIFSIDYLEKIHIFLFNDLYDIEDCKIRKEKKEELVEKVNIILEKIRDMLYFNETDGLKEEIYNIWKEQIFYDGNTRTILCYLKIISKIFSFNMDYDFTKDIENDYFINDVINSIGNKKQKIK